MVIEPLNHRSVSPDDTSAPHLHLHRNLHLQTSTSSLTQSSQLTDRAIEQEARVTRLTRSRASRKLLLFTVKLKYTRIESTPSSLVGPLKTCFREETDY